MAQRKVPVADILDTLQQMYPDAHCELNYTTPFELLIATILSAQCTDKRVNEITEPMFKQLNRPEHYLHLTQEEMEEHIKGLGLYKNKSKNILETCRILYEKYNGEVPQTHAELEALPGVGRKTANVVLSNAFGIPAIAVDTHVFRVGNRLGLAKSDNVDEVERQLMKRIPREKWSDAHHWLIWHGRRVCTARNPKCDQCPLQSMCKYALAEAKKAEKKTTARQAGKQAAKPKAKARTKAET
ncbi:endonuclease III [Brevibacillus gelatini]|uniref:Endonuclease III n=1 Tax=Brevibacillus gelatini TaxID=1655277 RepID=A0A3M8AMV5_9BACL|nr:endonuclease III [Brevibacillus gelatini]RNB52544.1 endonuclease III [Brevibacillus gelatini]